MSLEDLPQSLQSIGTTRGGDLIIENNQKLTNLAGLGTTSPLKTIQGKVVIENNGGTVDTGAQAAALKAIARPVPMTAAMVEAGKAGTLPNMAQNAAPGAAAAAAAPAAGAVGNVTAGAGNNTAAAGTARNGGVTNGVTSGGAQQPLPGVTQGQLVGGGANTGTTGTTTGGGGGAAGGGGGGATQGTGGAAAAGQQVVPPSASGR